MNTVEMIEKLALQSKSLVHIVEEITVLHFPKVVQQKSVGEMGTFIVFGVKFLQNVIYKNY